MTRLLTIPEVAEALAISRRSVYALISSGQLPVVDVATRGKPKSRVRADDLQTFIEKRTRTVRPGSRLRAAS